MLKSLGGNYVPGRSVDNLRYQDGVFVLDDPEETERPERFSMEELKYRVMQGMRRVIENGGLVLADEMHPKSMPMRARRSGDAVLLRTSFNMLYRAGETLVSEAKVIRVRCGGSVCCAPPTPRLMRTSSPGRDRAPRSTRQSSSPQRASMRARYNVSRFFAIARCRKLTPDVDDRLRARLRRDPAGAAETE